MNQFSLLGNAASVVSVAVYPFYHAYIPAGIPAPQHDASRDEIDLNKFLVQHPRDTFFIRARGESMRDAGIRDGAILVVDRARVPASGDIVVAILDGEFTVKRYVTDASGVVLHPENPMFQDIRVEAEARFAVWGVVTYVIHEAE
jgi:DNA polymerase V